MRQRTAASTPALAASPQKQTTRSPHGPLAIPCENCHTSSGWRPIRAVPEFDHNKTNYRLRGMHEKVPCAQCHAKPVFADVGKNCADCHADIHRRQMGSNCDQCHTVQGWNVATESVKDHQNRFPLLGAHAAVPCESCHKSAAVGQFLGLSTNCDSCHLKDWQTTTNPNHPSAGPAFASGNCQGCHSFDTWLGAKFDHSSTGFALTNGHANLPCASCHINNNYNLQIAPTDCGNAGCHFTTWQQTNNPTHSAAGPTFAVANCSNCHNTVSWNTSTFNHSTTGFQLTQGHANVPCASCHINNNYNLQIPPTDCGNAGCHLTTWQQTNNPVHSSSGAAFGAANCSRCHTPAGWDAASFDHSITGFTLVGTHMSPTPTSCLSCHINNNYTLSSTDCLSCHQPDWNKTQTLGGNVPNHVAANFPISAAACSSCHTITTWADGKFDHSTTGFPLANSHQMAPAGKVTACTQCHIGGNYSLNIQPNDCGNSGCHLTTWQQTNNPTHSSSGAPFAAANCATCHNTITWTTATFDHSTTGFALIGTHMSPTPTPCLSCHINNNYTLNTADCLSCHQPDWNKTQTLGGNVPNHITSNFPTSAAACSSCHTITVWADGKFDHSATGWPLTGSHQLAPAGKVSTCAQCHLGGNYTLTSANTACIGCHQTDWNSTATLGGVVPNHITSGFSTAQCATCHDTLLWADGKFDHSSTGWALTGAHADPTKAPCSSCHINGNYTLTAANTACYGCHLAAWQSTQTLGGSVPNHVAAGFPTTCDTAGCHNTTTWLGATFNHSPFFSIPHHGSVCNDCHQVSTDFSSFTCINCHTQTAHQQTQTNNIHNGVNGYSYGPTTCYNCHKNGGGG